MKRKLLLLGTWLLLALFLVACEAEVHWFGKTAYVPWFYVAVPVALFIALAVTAALCILSRYRYKCPRCGHVFKPKKTALTVSLHIGTKRFLRCPSCGKRSFCPVEKNSNGIK